MSTIVMEEQTRIGMPSYDLVAELEDVFQYHLKRDDTQNHWINVEFSFNGSVHRHYQYLNGLHNLTRLNEATCSKAKQFAEENNVEVVDEGNNYLTVCFDKSPLPEDTKKEVAFCEHLLNVIYGVSIVDICSVYEHNGYVGWKSDT